jgi:hypothetical protein
MPTERTIRLLTRLPEVDLAEDTIPKPVGLGSRVPFEGYCVRGLFGSCPLCVRYLFGPMKGEARDQR